jgi:hypothetical protein
MPTPADSANEWDVFISHASEDKMAFVQPLAEALRRIGLRVWYDKWALTVGDRLLQRIDEGLARSRFGIVILSRAFFTKNWPQHELDGLVSFEISERKVILPVWHGVTQSDVAQYSPILAGRFAACSIDGIDRVVEQLLAAIAHDTQAESMTQSVGPGRADEQAYRQQRSTLSETPILWVANSKLN